MRGAMWLDVWRPDYSSLKSSPCEKRYWRMIPGSSFALTWPGAYNTSAMRIVKYVYPLLVLILSLGVDVFAGAQRHLLTL